ncbi:hypothetical protein TNCV_3710981 [Trichonephila clavipes]|uniref:Uncharacterized protein n=1 Tax=Trichonephila clavipes TaxID=2585209 RepID=A0A8X6R788_TRICX|nr:hypothetical protein TNCV_3710981 [Trichonephila clavipes]
MKSLALFTCVVLAREIYGLQNHWFGDPTWPLKEDGKVRKSLCVRKERFARNISFLNNNKPFVRSGSGSPVVMVINSWPRDTGDLVEGWMHLSRAQTSSRWRGKVVGMPAQQSSLLLDRGSKLRGLPLSPADFEAGQNLPGSLHSFLSSQYSTDSLQALVHSKLFYSLTVRTSETPLQEFQHLQLQYSDPFIAPCHCLHRPTHRNIPSRVPQLTRTQKSIRYEIEDH